ncbi:glycosyltransferase family 61 protein [Mucilaginibacter ginsenosidivorax]|uniref:Glycosyltransferase family 61 protein n=1 Tax=Mucilaginibacter ginsenosidivorax TaxID=862126 RepID=A0A5B8W316_9SPHI|nr:glycosyltransferase family 61 protein [Mucilaginibacter ginsenosidivorax]QEC77919.1 glycosyltransferase family 61 protein [Mucilaginibacter ginsenosidivorax]
MIKTLLKKIWIRCFTGNPYQIKSFTDLYRPKMGEAIDRPESLTGILLHEPGQPIAYDSPLITYNQTVPWQIIGEQPRFKTNGVFREPERYLYSISKGTVWCAVGLVYDSQRRCFIDEPAKEWTVDLSDSALTNIVHFPQKIYLEGTTLSCLTNGADGGFYHFLFESIVKIHFALPVMKYVDHILLNGPATDWKLKWLQRANINTSKIIWTDNTPHYECEQLLFTGRLVNDQQINPWSIAALKALFNIAPTDQSTTHKTVWITRKGASSRDIAWEYKLPEHFPSIEIIDLSGLSAIETIEKMQSATHIIAPHGAGLSNIYLCKKGTHILELYPGGMSFKPCFHRLSSVCQLKHHVAWLNFEDENDDKQGLAFLKTLLNDFVCQN